MGKKCVFLKYQNLRLEPPYVNSKDTILRNVTDSNCIVVMDLMSIKVAVVKWANCETTNDVMFGGKQEICANTCTSISCGKIQCWL